MYYFEATCQACGVKWVPTSEEIAKGTWFNHECEEEQDDYLLETDTGAEENVSDSVSETT